MLTAAACQPMPGPMGAVWPSAKPGIEYCGPYPSCCPPAPRPWWQHLIGVRPDWWMHSLEAFLAIICILFFIACWEAAGRARAQRRRRAAGEQS